MEVKIWLKEQRIKSIADQRNDSSPFQLHESNSKSTKVLYETDLSTTEGLDTLYKVISRFLNENGFGREENIEITVIDNGTFFSFELEFDRHTEVYNAVVDLSEDEY